MSPLDNDHARLSDDLALPDAMRWTPTEVCCLDCGLPTTECPAVFHRHPNTTGSTNPTGAI